MEVGPFSEQIVPMAVLLILLEMLSLWETAVGGLNEAVLRKAAEEDEDKEAMKLLPMAEKADHILRALRCEQMICLLAEGGLAVSLAKTPERIVALLIVFLISTLLAVLAEGLYNGMDEKKRRRLSRQAGRMAALLMPVAYASDGLVKGLLALFGIKKEATSDEATEENILAMVDIGEELGTIEEDEKQMIENVFEFNNRLAQDIMIHRTDTVCLWAGESDEEVLRMIRETGLTRYPVYETDIDDIIGILNSRDYLIERQMKHPRPIRNLLRPAYFVPGTIQADRLFADMQKGKVHMAVVVDEYGGMSGIVTMEDLLEEIVGNIYDEFDPQAEAEIVRLQDNLWRISGTARLEDIQEALGLEMPVEECDTLSGLVFRQLTTIPVDGSRPTVDAAGLHICVEKLLEHRVESALVSRTSPQTPEGQTAE